MKTELCTAAARRIAEYVDDRIQGALYDMLVPVLREDLDYAIWSDETTGTSNDWKSDATIYALGKSGIHMIKFSAEYHSGSPTSTSSAELSERLIRWPEVKEVTRKFQLGGSGDPFRPRRISKPVMAELLFRSGGSVEILLSPVPNNQLCLLRMMDGNAQKCSPDEFLADLPNLFLANS